MNAINSYNDFTNTLAQSWQDLWDDLNETSDDEPEEISISDAISIYDNRHLILHKICCEIFSEQNQKYIDQWIEKDQKAAETFLTDLEEESAAQVSTNRIHILLAKVQLATRKHWIAPISLYGESVEITEKIIEFLDAKSLLSLTQSNRSFNMSNAISVALLDEKMFATLPTSFRFHGSFFYRHIMNAGPKLLSLHLEHGLDSQCLVGLQKCLHQACSNLQSLSLIGEDLDCAADFHLLPDRLTQLSYEGSLSALCLSFLPKTLKKLKIASLSDYLLTRSDIQHLPALTYLSLNVPICDFLPQDLPRTLIDFSLVTDSLTGIGHGWPPALKNLDVNANDISENYFITLPTSLEKLSICADAMGYHDLSHCSHLTDLCLNISNSGIILWPNSPT